MFLRSGKCLCSIFSFLFLFETVTGLDLSLFLTLFLFKSEGRKIVFTLSSSRYIKSEDRLLRNWTSKEAKVSSEKRISLFENACKSGLLKAAERIVKSLGFNDISAVSSIFLHSHEFRSNCTETYSNFYEKKTFLFWTF